MNKFFLTLSFFLSGYALSYAQDWVKLLEGFQSKNASKILTLPNGDFVISGQINEAGQIYNQSGYLVRTDPSGEILWEGRYGSTSADGAFILNEQFVDVALSTDGHLIAVGSRTPAQPNAYYISDVFVAKIDLEGKEIWKKYFNWSKTDVGLGVEALPNGELVICGNTNSFNVLGELDGFLMKINGDGELQWLELYDIDTGDEWLHDVILTSDQKLLAVGTAQLPNTGNRALALKIDLERNLEWRHTYGSYALKATAVVENKSGRFGLCGQGYGLNSSFVNLLMEIDGNGDEVWGDVYFPPGSIPVIDELFDLLPCDEGGYVAVGVSGIDPFDGFHFIRVDAAGDTLKTVSFFDGAPYTEFGLSLTWTQDGGLAAAGGRVKPGGDYDLVLLHTSDFGCTKPGLLIGTQELPVLEAVISPNPAKDIILLSLPSNTAISQIQVYDLSGKLITQQNAQNIREINVSKLQNGTYFLKIKSESGQVFLNRFLKMD